MASLGMYDGYDSYNESGSSGEDEENQPYQSGQKLPFNDMGYRQDVQQVASKPNRFRFMNGRDGMGMCTHTHTQMYAHACKYTHTHTRIHEWKMWYGHTNTHE